MTGLKNTTRRLLLQENRSLKKRLSRKRQKKTKKPGFCLRLRWRRLSAKLNASKLYRLLLEANPPKSLLAQKQRKLPKEGGNKPKKNQRRHKRLKMLPNKKTTIHLKQKKMKMTFLKQMKIRKKKRKTLKTRMIRLKRMRMRSKKMAKSHRCRTTNSRTFMLWRQNMTTFFNLILFFKFLIRTDDDYLWLMFFSSDAPNT